LAIGGTSSSSGLKGKYSSGGTVGFFRFTTSISSGAGISTFSRIWAITSSRSKITGVLYFSLKLNALIVKVSISLTVEGARAIIG
jgi:hypothetical protein